MASTLRITCCLRTMPKRRNPREEMPAVTVTSFTSFIQLFGRNNGELEVKSVEIPLIQRDYAQAGRGRISAGSG